MAGASWEVHSPDFQPNPNAPAGNNMGRLTTWLKDLAKRKQGQEKRALERSDSVGSQSAGSSVEIVHRFVGKSAPKKLKSVQEEIKAKSRLHKSSHYLDSLAPEVSQPSPAKAEVSHPPPAKADDEMPSCEPSNRAPMSGRPSRTIKKPHRLAD
jgi:hypothetical protein